MSINIPTVIDLYSGVGGLSLGAARAGFSVIAAAELDRIAISTHAKNFPKTRHLNIDVSSLNGIKLLELAGIKSGELDGIIGGPPCQGFSTIGHQLADDPRNALFGHFFRLVMEAKPKFFLAENVPGILAEKNSTIREEALKEVKKEYKLLDPIVVSANDLGAPTRRKRVFFIGYDPKRVNDLDYSDLRGASKIPRIVVGHALKGLPSIRSDWASEEQGWRKTKEMPNDEFFSRVTDRIPLGIGDISTIEQYKEKNIVSGCLGTVHEKHVVERFNALRHGEKDPISKASRLDPNGFCPTLRAGTASDRGSYQAVRPIHPGSPRVITPREAARLQGFPDWFLFHPTKWHAFRQIGNSVSPIVAEQILSNIFENLK